MNPELPAPVRDDVCGTTLDGHDVTDGELLDLVRSSGSLVIMRDAAQRLRRSDWFDSLVARAFARQQQVSVRDSSRFVIVTGVDDDDEAYSTFPRDQIELDQASARAAHPSRRPIPSLRIVPSPKPTEQPDSAGIA